jgi:hypothetical protein
MTRITGHSEVAMATPVAARTDNRMENFILEEGVGDEQGEEQKVDWKV